MSKHTELPWMIIEDDHQEDVIIVQKKNYQPGFYSPVSESLSKENAEFILKTVNNHERLVEALENVINAELRFDHNEAIGKAKQLLTELKEE